MTWTKKQKLPALHQSGKVKNPDMPEVEQQNYTSTVLKYANLALPFPQLETDAKRVVPAINELHKNRTIANPEEPADQDPLNTVQIAGTVYKIEGGGGGDYTAGAGIYFSGENNSVINADAGRFSPAYTYQGWDAEYTGDYQGDWRPGWEDSGTTEEGHTVYQSAAGTYMMSSGNSICTYRVAGYGQYNIYVKQNPETSGFRYAVFGYQNSEIDFDTGHYDYSCQDRSDSDYIRRTYYSDGSDCFVQVMYHKEPMAQGVTLDLKNDQWVDTGTTVDGHTVYKSDVGSWHISNGSSICTLKIVGITSFTIYFRSSSESGYDWAYVGNLDTDVSRISYKSRLSGETSYSAVTFECSSGEHMVQVMYAKDSSVNSYDDRGYFYYVINEYAPTPPEDDRAYSYIEVSNPITPRGEIFNDYERNIALGDNAHAEGYNARAYGTASHAEGFSNKANNSYTHAEGIDNIAYGSASHVEGGQNKTLAEKSHAEGMNNIAGAPYSHVEGAYNQTMGERSHAEGANTLAQGHNSHTEGRETQALGLRDHAEGYKSVASGGTSHAEGWETLASGSESHAEGYHTTSSGAGSHAEGYHTTSSGSSSHSEGNNTEASGFNSHSEGEYTKAQGRSSHSEGYGDSNTYVISSGQGSHAEGGFTSATADFAHAEGRFTIASGAGSHAEGFGGYGGQYNTASGIASHAEGSGNLVSGNCGHAEGTRNTVYSESGHADGSGNRVYGHEAHGEGAGTLTVGRQSHTEGAGNYNIADASHIEGGGNRNTYNAYISHTEGAGNVNYGLQAHAEGSGNRLSGEESHVEGAGNMVHGAKTHGEGGGNIAYGMGSHIEGKHNLLVGFGNHAEGISNHIGFAGNPGYFSYGTTYAVGDIVGVNDVYRPTGYTEGTDPYLFYCTTAPGQIQASANVNIVTPTEWNSSTTYGLGSIVRISGVGYYYNPNQVSTNENPALGGPWWKITNILSPFRSSGSGYYLLDAEGASSGYNQVAVVYNGTVEPMWTPIASPKGAHIEGVGNISVGDYQHVQGKYNVADSTKAFIIGNGTDTDARSNALTVDWSGNTNIAGDLTTGVTLATTAQTVGAAINEISVRVPAPPTTDGNYTLSLTVTDGVPTYTWILS